MNLFLPLRFGMIGKAEIIKNINRLGEAGKPFTFLVDFEGNSTRIFSFFNSQSEILWQTPNYSNYTNRVKKTKPVEWEISPVSLSAYKKGFQKIQNHIFSGDTYLLNYTQPTQIKTNLNLEEIYHLSKARYKILLKNKFVCFSPEPFVKINDGIISSFPMKGTMDANVADAHKIILNDSKELAEHNTIVDLIRNDLSLVAENVHVEKFRYLERIKTNQNDLWQVSSKITGKLPDNFRKYLGEIIFKMLPAGSVTGAPKKKTVEIIREAENYNRGFYTGIFGIFDGKNLDSCVLIRFIENYEGKLIYKSGGGITFMSELQNEYDEMVKKIYIPF